MMTTDHKGQAKEPMPMPILPEIPRDVLVQSMMRAWHHAGMSPDPSTQNGAAIINAGGEPLWTHCNGFPAGANGYVKNLPSRLERPAKYDFIEHAERAAIFMAARTGKSLYNSTMVAVWAACTDCARAMIQVGITRLIRLPLVGYQGRWDNSIQTADQMLLEAGIRIVEDPFPELAALPPLLRDGAPFQIGVS